MAFTRDTLSGGIGAGSSAPKLYTYSTADAKSAVIASDYFLGAYPFLAKGDIIVATFATGGSIGACSLVVTAATSSTVTTAYTVVA